jgi:hypothetical protein
LSGLLAGEDKMPMLRFTGARTGLTGIWLPKYGGAIERGREIEVPDEVAERWLEPPSDFELVEGERVESFWSTPASAPEPIAIEPTKKSRKKTEVHA